MQVLLDQLDLALERGASDLHWKIGEPAAMRVYGSLQTGGPVVEENDLTCFLNHIRCESSDEDPHHYDAAFQHQGHTFRYQLYHSEEKSSVAIRHISKEARPLDDLGLPQKFREMLSLSSGLILITGPTGSGKSTTLTSAVNYLNETLGNRLIITLEDPVEFRHENKRCIIRHREYRRDFSSFPQAIKYAMRQDPDIILVGEMRDYETIAAALSATETGHLVLATMHNRTAPDAIGRILDAAKDHEPGMIASQLAANLACVLAQQLPSTIDGKRCGCYELLVQTTATQTAIREGRARDLHDEIARGFQQGMQSFDESLYQLVSRRRISVAEALSCSTRPDLLKPRIQNFR